MAFSLDPGHVSPVVEAGAPGFGIIQHIHDAATWRDDKGTPIPWLVEKWEQANDTTLRLHLRKGVKFHNGEEFTADALKQTVDKYIAPDSKSPNRTILSVIKETKIVDPYTAEWVTEKPNRPLLRNSTWIQVLSPKAMKEVGDKLATNPVGTGPFKFVEYQPGQHVLMERNPSYWQPTKFNFDRLRFRFIPENGTRVSALEAGEVMMVNNVPPDSLDRLKKNPNLKVLVSPTNRSIFVQMRVDRKPFNDKRVRQALNYAVDKDALTKDVMLGLAPIARAPLPIGLFGFYDGLPPYKYDPERAKKMLADAGATGATIKFGAPNGRYLLDKQVAEALVGYMTAVGLKVDFENPTWSTYVTEVIKYEKTKYDAYMFGWGVANEPDQEMSEWFHSKNAGRRSGYNNPEVDKAIDEGAQSFDETRVKAAYQRAQELIWDDCPWIWLYQQPDVNAINARLNWAPGRTDEYLLFWDATLQA